MRSQIIEALARTLPATFSRTSVPQFMPGLISAGHLANLSTRGLGPEGMRVGKKFLYEKTVFLTWLAEYLTAREVRRDDSGESAGSGVSYDR